MTQPISTSKVSEVSQGCLTRHIYANVLDNDTVTQHHSQILVLCLDVNRPWHRTSWGLSLFDDGRISIYYLLCTPTFKQSESFTNP